jgi:hypothetical protein
MKYFTIYIITYSVLFLNLSLYSQPSSGINPFKPPLDFSLSVSGNFGEIRSDHFHSGIDIRTQGVTGKYMRQPAVTYRVLKLNQAAMAGHCI